MKIHPTKKEFVCPELTNNVHIYKTDAGFITVEPGLPEKPLTTATQAEKDDYQQALAVQTQVRRAISQWLSSLYKSDHLALLVGNGLTMAVNRAAQTKPPEMGRLEITHPLNAPVRRRADEVAHKGPRGKANFEDDLRVALELCASLLPMIENKEVELRLVKAPADPLDVTGYCALVVDQMKALVSRVLQMEFDLNKKLVVEADLHTNPPADLKTEGLAVAKTAAAAISLLQRFLLSFSCRPATSERLHVFTTNYDRLLEFGFDGAGILTLDRFKGKVNPVFRTSRLDLDYHYSPPGIRSEPHYLEGVVRLTKLHGSVDWRFSSRERHRVERHLLPFGADEEVRKQAAEGAEKILIFPNSAKDYETTFYPYAELFRDFSAAVCRPNATLLVYGYSFGDDHINRTIGDMLTVPSTHLAIIAFGDHEGRLARFLNGKNPQQITLLYGTHFADLQQLVDHYLPRTALARIDADFRILVKEAGASPAVGQAAPTPVPPNTASAASAADPATDENDLSV